MEEYVVLTTRFQKEGKKWVAICEELGTSTFGRSLPEAEKRLEEAVFMHLNTLEDVDERERFFKENNIVIHRKPTKEVRICMPTDSSYFYRPYVVPPYGIHPKKERVTA